MAFEIKENSGSLFRNEKRENENHPHATGKCLINGVLYWVSAWTKEGSKGRFQSLAFKPVEQKQETPPSSDRNNQRTRPKGNEFMGDMDDMIPF